jgi:Ca-activated chloride channel family protein
MNRTQTQTGLIIAGVIVAFVCICGILILTVGGNWLNTLGRGTTPQPGSPVTWAADSADLTVAVAPGMAPLFNQFADQFNRQQLKTSDGQLMQIKPLTLAPNQMVEQSLGAPAFQAIAPDSSLWLGQIEQRWAAAHAESETTALIPIGTRRVGTPVRYAVSPIVVAAWENVARDLGWPEKPVGWRTIQRRATEDPNFKWNHPSTGHASGMLATLAEFYAGAGLTRDLTPEAAKKQDTLDYVRAVEATIRFYGEGEDVIVQKLAEQGQNFLDAFVTQEQTVIAWNQAHPDKPLVALYPAEGTLWADHPFTLLELGGNGETAVTDNQRRTFQAFVEFLTSAEVQKQVLAAGYRPADLSLKLDEAGSPFAGTSAVDWRQPQTTLQIPSPAVVEVVQNVWWYTKKPTNVILVVDTSGSMQGQKIARTREALQAFVAQIQGPRDQVGLLEFSSGTKSSIPLQPLDEQKRATLMAKIDALEAGGETALIDAVIKSYDTLLVNGDPSAINALVVMTDGNENASAGTLNDLQRRFQKADRIPVVIFTIAFGKDADEELLMQIAELGNGQFRRADETDIKELYQIISTYF